MDGRPVLVATEYEDPTADLVITELNRRQVPVLRFDPGQDFPARAVLTVYKPLHAGAYHLDGEPAGIWADVVEPDDIGDGVSHCAHLFQAQVPKSSDVRAVVVGDRVFCARITSPPGVVDWRARYQDLSYGKVECPDQIRGALLTFICGFRLNFGAFDFAVTPDGAWWFLECNPNGQWAWLEHAAGLPITSAIADLLENGDTRWPAEFLPKQCERNSPNG